MSADQESVNLRKRQKEILRNLELLWKEFVKIVKTEVVSETQKFDTKINILFKEFKNNHNNIIISKCSDDHYEEDTVENIVLLKENFFKAIDDASSSKDQNEIRQFYDLVDKQIELEEKIETLLKDTENWSSVKQLLSELFTKFDENDHQISSMNQDNSIYESAILNQINSLRKDYQNKLDSIELNKKDDDSTKSSEIVFEIEDDDGFNDSEFEQDDERLNDFPAKNSTVRSDDEEHAEDNTSPTEIGMPRTEESSFTNVSNFTNISIQSVDVKSIQDFLARNQHMCRICLKTKPRNLLTSLNSLSEIGDNIASMVEFCTGLDVNQDKHLPQNMCLECLVSMQECYKMKKMTLDSNMRIKDRFNNILENIRMDDQVRIECDASETLEISHETTDEMPTEDKVEMPETAAEMANPKEGSKVDLKDIKPVEKQLPVTLKSCTECIASFATDRGLKVHIYQIHKKGLQSNESSTANSSTMEKKTKKDQPSGDLRYKGFKCFCKQKLPSTREAILHIKEHLDKDKVFSCKKCKFVSKSSLSIYYHIKSHQEKFVKTCSNCNKVFTSKVVYWNHCRDTDNCSNNGEKSCGICSAKTKTITAMKDHLKSNHMYNGKFTCPFCKTFTTITPANAFTHLKSCESKSQLICKVCSKQCLNRNQFTRHVYNHSLQKYFDCEYCGKSISFKNNMQKHVKAVHGLEVTKYIDSTTKNVIQVAK